MGMEVLWQIEAAAKSLLSLSPFLFSVSDITWAILDTVLPHAG